MTRTEHRNRIVDSLKTAIDNAGRPGTKNDGGQDKERSYGDGTGAAQAPTMSLDEACTLALLALISGNPVPPEAQAILTQAAAEADDSGTGSSGY